MIDKIASLVTLTAIIAFSSSGSETGQAREGHKLVEQKLSYWDKRTVSYLSDQLEQCLDSESNAAKSKQRKAKAFPNSLEQRAKDLQEELAIDLSDRRLGKEYKDKLAKDLPDLERRQNELSSKLATSKTDPTKFEEELDLLERDLQSDLIGWSKIKDVGPLNVIVWRIRAKINEGTRDGRLSEGEIANANRELVRVRELQDRWSTDNGRVREWEWKTLRLLAIQLEDIVAYQLANSIASDKSEAKVSTSSRENPKCLWYPSRHGGYFDASGNVNGSILGNELCRYGGQMADGSPAPKTAQVKVDSHGHLM